MWASPCHSLRRTVPNLAPLSIVAFDESLYFRLWLNLWFFSLSKNHEWRRLSCDAAKNERKKKLPKNACARNECQIWQKTTAKSFKVQFQSVQRRSASSGHCPLGFVIKLCLVLSSSEMHRNGTDLIECEFYIFSASRLLAPLQLQLSASVIFNSVST